MCRILRILFHELFIEYAEELKIKKIIGLDNFMLNEPDWLKISLEIIFSRNSKFNIIKDDLKFINGLNNANYILHMASIASPSFYRKFPIETLDANIWGLRILDYYSQRDVKGF